MRSAILVVLAACVAGLGFPAAASPPNIVLILADDFGYECVGANGCLSYRTPELDRMAAEGMRFTQCYAQPLCTPTRVKLMTGRSNWRNYKAFGVLVPGEITFAQVLKSAGYKTCVVGKWQLTGGGPESGTWNWGTPPDEAGFDEYCLWAYWHYLNEKNLADYRSRSGLRGQTSRYWHPAVLENGKYRPTGPDDYGPDVFTSYLLDFIERNKEGPFFAYYPMVLTHSPFVATPHSKEINRRTKFTSDARFFKDMVEYTDYLVGKILRRIEELGIADNTLVIFTGDNGTGRGIRTEMRGRAVIGAKGHPTDAGTRVPMIVWGAGVKKPGTATDALIDMSDFLPTLAEAAGAPLPEVELDGHSFYPLLQGRPYTEREWIFMHYDADPNRPKSRFPPVRFARTKRYKLYHDGRFYDVPNDWEEQRPIPPGEETPEVRRVREMLQRVLDSIPPARYGSWKGK